MDNLAQDIFDMATSMNCVIAAQIKLNDAVERFERELEKIREN